MKLRHFSISQQGDSHISVGKNCQDYSDTISIVNKPLQIELAIAAIADGVGSCDYSEDGSRLAVTTVLRYLNEKITDLEDVSETTILPLIKKSFQIANEKIEQEAEERELPFLLFDTTLTVTVLTENGSCYVGHIGDDGVVALFEDGTYSMITSRIEGEEANSVIPLSSVENWTFGYVKKPVAALALMTDGILDKSVGSDRMNHRVYYPFFKPMFENIMENEQDVEDLRSYWNDFLHDSEFRKGYNVTDDITLAIVQLTSILEKVKPAPFDEEKWNRDTQETREEIEKQLKESDGARIETYSLQRKEIDQVNAQANAPHNCESSDIENSKSEKRIDAAEQMTEVDERRDILAVGGRVNPDDTSEQPDDHDTKIISQRRSNKDELKGKSPDTKRIGYPNTKPSNRQSVKAQFNANQSTASQPTSPLLTEEHSNASGVKITRTNTTQNKKKVKTEGDTDGEEKKRRSLKISKSLLFSMVLVVCMLVLVFLVGKIEFNKGFRSGEEERQLRSQQQIAEMQLAHESELKGEYKRGFDAGKQDALMEANKASASIVTPKPSIDLIEQFVIEHGQKGDYVAYIQKKLQDKGWKIEIDKEYGTNTESAVRDFQTVNHLLPTGKVDILTFWMLMNEESNGSEHFEQSVVTPVNTSPTPSHEVDVGMQDDEMVDSTLDRAPQETAGEQNAN